MEINKYDVWLPGHEKPISIGLNVTSAYGQTCINMFGLEENQGEKPSRHMRQIAQQLTKDLFKGDTLESLKWTYTATDQTSQLEFSPADRQPQRIHWSNRYAAQHERVLYLEGMGTLDYYRQNFMPAFGTGASEFKRNERTRERTRTPEPETHTAYAIPCNDPHCTDGYFYCKPDLTWKPGEQDSGYETVMVDVNKLIAQLRRDNPHMLEHARIKYNDRCDGAEAVFRNNSISAPTTIGSFSFDQYVGKERDRRNSSIAGRALSAAFHHVTKDRFRGETAPGLTMVTGDAAILLTMQELKLTHVPISVPKEQANELRKIIGWSGRSQPAPGHHHAAA